MGEDQKFDSSKIDIKRIMENFSQNYLNGNPTEDENFQITHFVLREDSLILVSPLENKEKQHDAGVINHLSNQYYTPVMKEKVQLSPKIREDIVKFLAGSITNHLHLVDFYYQHDYLFCGQAPIDHVLEAKSQKKQYAKFQQAFFKKFQDIKEKKDFF